MALTFHCDHPYADGVLVTSQDGDPAELGQGKPLRLASEPGEHRLSVAARTPYGVLAARPLQHAVR